MNFRRISWAIGVALTLGPTPAAQGPSGTFDITVVDVRGKPIEGATVRVMVRTGTPAIYDLSAEPLAKVTTDARGQARVDWSSPQQQPVIVVSAPGYRTIARNPSGVSAPWVLEPGRSVKFTILDDGKPVTGWVEWTAPDTRIGIGVTSDEQGGGVLAGIAQEAVQVFAHTALRSVESRVEPRVETVTLALPQGATLQGRTVDEEGKPLSGVVIAIRAPRSPGALVSDADGRFRVGGLAAGLYQLEYSMVARMIENLEANLELGQTLTLATMTMRRGLRVTALIRDRETGEPVPNAHVFRESNEVSGFDMRDIRRPATPFVGGPDGRIVAEGLSPGVVKLVLDTPPYARTRIAELELKVETGDVDLGIVDVGRGARLLVTLRDRGNRARSDVRVRLDQGPGISPVKEVVSTTDAEGRATFERLGIGRYRLRAGGNGFAVGPPEIAAEWFTIDAADDIRKDLVVGGVNATLMITSGGIPLAHHNVTIRSDAPGTQQLGTIVSTSDATGVRILNAPFTPIARGTTDAEGRVALRDVFVWPSRVSVSLDGGGSWTAPFVVPDNDVEAAFSIPAGAATVIVRDTETREALRFGTASWNAAGNVTVSAIRAGDERVTLRGLPDGPGKLTVGAGADHEPLNLALDGPDRIPAEVLLKPTPPTRVRVAVVGDDGQPLRDASVELSRTFFTTKADGSVETSTPLRSAVQLIVRRVGYAPHMRSEVSLRPGLNNLGTIRMLRGYRVKVTAPPPVAGVSEQYRVRVIDSRGASIESALDDRSASIVPSDGEASLGLLAPGSYTVELVGKSTRRATVRVGDADTEVTVR